MLQEQDAKLQGPQNSPDSSQKDLISTLQGREKSSFRMFLVSYRNKVAFNLTGNGFTRINYAMSHGLPYGLQGFKQMGIRTSVMQKKP